MIISVKKIFSLILISTFCFAGCTNSSEFYVQGLVNLESQQKEKATKNFEKAIKNGSSVEVLLSLKELEKLNIPKSKMLKLSKLAVNTKKNPEAETYNYYLQSLVDNQKYNQVIELASKLLLEKKEINVDWAKYCYVFSLAKKENTLENSIILSWLTEEKFSKYQIKFFEEFASERFFYDTEIGKTTNLILQFRIELFNKNYNFALEKLSEIFESLDDISKFSPQMISDFGKSFLYGNFEIIKTNFNIETKNEFAQKIKVIADNLNLENNSKVQKEKLFYLYFYAGRLFDKTGAQFYNNAKECFLLASENAITNENYDNAIWYYLNQSKKESYSSLMNGIKKYGNFWKDKFYYSDLLKDLKLHLLSTRQWTAFCKFYPTIEQVADEQIKSSWAYLTARLIKEEFVSSENFASYLPSEIFRKIFENTHSSIYYQIMSAWQLGLEPKNILQNMCQVSDFFSLDENKTTVICNLLDACIKYKKIQSMYKIIQQYKKYLSSDVLSFYAKKLNQDFISDTSLYPTILRVASSAFSSDGSGKDEELLKLFYPRYFYDLVKLSCKEFNLSESLLFGLIRSESYFDEDVFSSAGAAGLTQLMSPTASDVARKLRIKDYDLLDAKTNITFGSFYLSDMIRLFEGSTMLSVISYNTGRARIRSWVKKYPNVPMDIWMEMLPYEESREYGKKILSSTFIYELLYYGEDSYHTVQKFMEY